MKLAKTLLKILAWVVGGVVALVVVVYLVALAINLNDQPPSETVERFRRLVAERPPVVDADNGYVYLAGFSVAPGEDPRAWGARRVAWAEKILAQPAADPVAGFLGEDHDFKRDRSDAVKALADACRKADAACLAAFETGEKHVAEWLAAEAWLLARYKALLAHEGWREPVPWDERIPLPQYWPVHEGQKLLLTEAWTLAGKGDAAGVRRLLEADVRLWRRALAEADNLIPKLNAAAALRRHFGWSNLVLRRLPANVAAAGVPPSWKQPLTDAERSMLRSLAGEWAFYDRGMRRTVESGTPPPPPDETTPTLVSRVAWRLFKPMYQVQDTGNRYAAMLQSVATALDVPCEHYSQAVERARAIHDEAIEDAFPHRIYNVVGDTVFALGAYDVTAYAARVTDLEGVRRAALLAVDLRTRGIPSGKVAAALPGVSLRSPYDGTPFTWDARAQAIVFFGLEDGDAGLHRIVY